MRGVSRHSHTTVHTCAFAHISTSFCTRQVPHPLRSHIWNQLWLYKGRRERPQKATETRVFYLVCSSASETPLEPPRVCVCVGVHNLSSASSLTFHHCSTLEPCMEVCSQKGKQRPETAAGLGRSTPPSSGLLSHSICVVFGISRPDKDGVSTCLSWERALWKVPDPFVSHTVDPRTSTGKAKGKEGWLWGRDHRQVAAAVALRLLGARSRFRDSGAWDQGVSPQTSSGPPSA